MKLKPIKQILSMSLIPLGVLLGGAAMATSTPPPTDSTSAKTKDTSSASTSAAQAPSEDADTGGQEGTDAFEQASGMKRDQPTGPDRTPDMEQQQPHDSQIEHKVEKGLPSPAPSAK